LPRRRPPWIADLTDEVAETVGAPAESPVASRLHDTAIR
jgi:hypothetical protein